MTRLNTPPCKLIYISVVAIMSSTSFLQQAAAYERGMADRGRQAEAEAVQLQHAAEKALEEVKQGARTTIEEMSSRHSEELNVEIK